MAISGTSKIFFILLYVSRQGQITNSIQGSNTQHTHTQTHLFTIGTQMYR